MQRGSLWSCVSLVVNVLCISAGVFSAGAQQAAPTQQGLSAASRAERRYGPVQVLEKWGKWQWEQYWPEMGIGVGSPPPAGDGEGHYGIEAREGAANGRSISLQNLIKCHAH